MLDCINVRGSRSTKHNIKSTFLKANKDNKEKKLSLPLRDSQLALKPWYEQKGFVWSFFPSCFPYQVFFMPLYNCILGRGRPPSELRPLSQQEWTDSNEHFAAVGGATKIPHENLLWNFIAFFLSVDKLKLQVFTECDTLRSPFSFPRYISRIVLQMGVMGILKLFDGGLWMNLGQKRNASK